jgi:hypothetical protein
MNSIGMNVPGRKPTHVHYERLIVDMHLYTMLFHRWIRFEEDFDVEMQRWQGFNHFFCFVFVFFVLFVIVVVVILSKQMFSILISAPRRLSQFS